MKIDTFVTNRMVKGKDLNHHGTLFAGRSAQWFVEAGFIAAANLTRPESILCLKIYGMLFKKPVKMGSVIRFESKIVHTGRTSLVAYIRLFFSHNVGNFFWKDSLPLYMSTNMGVPYLITLPLTPPIPKISNFRNGPGLCTQESPKRR